jgi:hypothetical protein
VSSSAQHEPRHASSLRPYELLHEHAERELALAGSGDVEGLLALGARWRELISVLPEQPPPAAAQLLERAWLIHERTSVELMRLREGLLADLASTGRAKRAASGYAGQLRRRPRVDRSA